MSFFSLIPCAFSFGPYSHVISGFPASFSSPLCSFVSHYSKPFLFLVKTCLYFPCSYLHSKEIGGEQGSVVIWLCGHLPLFLLTCYNGVLLSSYATDLALVKNGGTIQILRCTVFITLLSVLLSEWSLFGASYGGSDWHKTNLGIFAAVHPLLRNSHR